MENGSVHFLKRMSGYTLNRNMTVLGNLTPYLFIVSMAN
jgi:hypothetical protein